jgi:hypothetical protein
MNIRTIALIAASFAVLPVLALSTVEVNPFTGGVGDLVSTNNLSDVASTTTSRTNLSAAKSGANSDITSLSGLTTPLSTAQGGTNKSLTAVNGGSVYMDADSLEVTAAGSAGQVLTSNGAAAPTWETASGGSLQSAYDGGTTISVDDGSPVTITKAVIAGANNLLLVSDLAQSTGLFIDLLAGPRVIVDHFATDSSFSNSTVLVENSTFSINPNSEFRLKDDDSSNYVRLRPAAVTTANWDLRLPPDDGDAGEFLQTNGSGTATWERPVTALVTGTPAAASATCTATCASGVLTGGGCTNDTAIALQKSYPSSTTVWSCEYATALGTCTAYAICI